LMRPFLVMLREVRSYLRDRGDLAFSLLLPIVLVALMLGAFGGELDFNGTANIVNQDDGPYAQGLIDSLTEIRGLEVRLLSASDADSRLERANILLAIYIPEDFSEKLYQRQSTELLFKQRGTGDTEGQIVASQVRSIAQELSREIGVHVQVETALAGSGIPSEEINSTADEFLESERNDPVVEVREETVGMKLDPLYLFVPGMLTMFSLFAATLNAQSMVEERKAGTLERLMTTQLGVGQLFAGKFLAGAARGFTQILILVALAYMVFQLFTPLSFLYTLVIGLVFAAAVSALGMVIGSVARTSDQAVWIAVFFTMAMAMLGGTFFEIGETGIIHTVSKISICSYANNALRTVISEGGSLANVGLELGILAGVCMVALLISRIFFRIMPRASSR